MTFQANDKMSSKHGNKQQAQKMTKWQVDKTAD